MKRQQTRLAPGYPAFRLRWFFALLAFLALYGWVGQQDYEDARRMECAQRAGPARDYDPAADRCIEPRAQAHTTEN